MPCLSNADFGICQGIFQDAAKMSLTDIVNSYNPYADFEKKDDDWVLIKT